MKAVDQYNQSYEKLIKEGRDEYLPNQSLLNFLKAQVLTRLPINQSLNVLELGCGHGSVFQFLETPNWNVEAFDFSNLAIDLAIEKNQHTNINFLNHDITSGLNKDNYDLVVDSHLLHCLAEPSHWSISLQSIFDSLKDQAVFVLETMVCSKRMHFDEGLNYQEEDGVLKRGGTPIRRILPARVIEDELLKIGFEIFFLRVYENYKIIPNDQRDKALATDPDLMQVLCRRA